MAFNMPIPAPPRTPSPLSEDETEGTPVAELRSAQRIFFDPNTLLPSPMSETFSHRYSFSSLPTSRSSVNSSLSPDSAEDLEDEPETFRNPFNFQTTTYTAGKPTPSKSVRFPDRLIDRFSTDIFQNVGQRRGHKYKHSSVSHQIFLEPAPRAPLRLPASLPVPTTREGWKSMSREQRVRLSWCFCHLFVAGYVQWNAGESLSITALSHLIFYDAIGAFLCAGVEVLGNFEVWKRASIRQPFGLERSEVVVGFAMSILLLFMGFDLISHNFSHALENLGDHIPHVVHDHIQISPGSNATMSLFAMASTLISAVMLKNHARIAKAMRFATVSFLPAFLSNPSHLVTLSCSGMLLAMPMLPMDVYTWMDRVLSTAIALFMCLLGFQLVKGLGAMLLMSYTGDGIADVLRDIETDPNVKVVEEAKFWQVHYGLCMANLKLRVRGTEDSLTKLRERVTSIIKTRLGGNYAGEGGQLWEVSTQLIIDKD